MISASGSIRDVTVLGLGAIGEDDVVTNAAALSAPSDLRLPIIHPSSVAITFKYAAAKRQLTRVQHHEYGPIRAAAPWDQR
jgi:hypothetical protein